MSNDVIQSPVGEKKIYPFILSIKTFFFRSTPAQLDGSSPDSLLALIPEEELLSAASSVADSRRVCRLEVRAPALHWWYGNNRVEIMKTAEKCAVTSTSLSDNPAHVHVFMENGDSRIF